MYLDVQTDFLVNGRGGGAMGERLAETRYETGLMRPYFDKAGRQCITINTGHVDDKGNPIYRKHLVSEFIQNGITVNGPTSLRKDQWITLDNAVIRAARQRLRAWADLSAVSSFGGFDGMSKIMLEYETMSDPGEAFVDMDTMTEGRNDAPKFQLEGIPLPITHCDFWFSARRLAVSRNGGTPIDTTMGEAAGRRVAEKIEDTLIGVATGITFGNVSDYSRTSSVYGYLNFPARTTKTNLTAPTAGGWTPKTTVDEVITMIQLAADNNFFGPFMLYYSTPWDTVMDSDYNVNYGGVSLRQRLAGIDSLQGIRRLDRLGSAYGYDLILVQMTSEVARAINGMDITTVQWESMGGMRRNFKVMAIQVPQLRANFAGKTGIVHAVTA